TVYQYDQARNEFLVEGTGPTIAGRLREPAPMRTRVHPGDVPFYIVRNRLSTVRTFFTTISNGRARPVPGSSIAKELSRWQRYCCRSAAVTRAVPPAKRSWASCLRTTARGTHLTSTSARRSPRSPTSPQSQF